MTCPKPRREEVDSAVRARPLSLRSLLILQGRGDRSPGLRGRGRSQLEPTQGRPSVPVRSTVLPGRPDPQPHLSTSGPSMRSQFPDYL